MKRLFIFSILVILTTIDVWAQGEVVFDSESHNFGKVDQEGGVVSHTFTYTNNSATPFVIISVETGCGCTTPEYSKKPAIKGQSGEITISYDPMNRPGRILKRIKVTSNHGVRELFIDGTVSERELTMEEKYPFIIGGGARLNLLSHSKIEVGMGMERKLVVGVANTNTQKAVEVEIDSDKLDDMAKAKISKSRLEPGEEATIEVVLTGREYGLFQCDVPLIINGKGGLERIILAGGVVDNFASWSRQALVNAPKIDFSTRMIRGSEVKKGSLNSYTLEIRNSGKSPLIIREVNSSKSMEVLLPKMEIKAGAKVIAKLNYTPLQEGYDSQVVRFVVNDPNNPMAEIRLVAQVVGD